LYDKFPAGKIVSDEAPDFIVSSTNGKRIGIELVEIFPNQTREERAHLQLTKNISALIELAKKQFESLFQLQLMVSLSFNSHFRCSKSERNKFAKLLAEDVHNCYNRMDLSSNNHRRFNKEGLVTPYLEHVLIYPKEIRNGLWDSGFAALTRDLQFQELAEGIRTKEISLPTIRKKVNLAWLLIVEPFDMLGYDSAYLFQEIITGYDRIFMLRTIFDEVIEFK
jgi:hypothetical protein